MAAPYHSVQAQSFGHAEAAAMLAEQPNLSLEHPGQRRPIAFKLIMSDAILSLGSAPNVATAGACEAGRITLVPIIANAPADPGTREALARTALRGTSGRPDPVHRVTREEILLSSGMIEEAYTRYGLRANQAGTYLATFRAVAKKYPHEPASEILADLVTTTPGDEGKWFAAAKDAGLYDDALALARRTPCDPRTLARAARDFRENEPAFAIGAGLLALHWLAQGHGYDVTSADVWDAYRATMAAAEYAGTGAEVKERIRALVAAEHADGFVAEVLARELGR